MERVQNKFGVLFPAKRILREVGGRGTIQGIHGGPSISNEGIREVHEGGYREAS